MSSLPRGFNPPIVGSSSSAAKLRDLVMSLSRSEASLLVTGESGVGKEVLCRNLHRFSRRREGPFVSINCAALAPGILESELFGHRRGAFTGAVRSHAGLFEQANGGTLFLDEVAEIPPFIQAKLLRVLQEREVRRMGEAGVRRVDARVISATNADLHGMVAAGGFRKDLFYRLNVIEVNIRPLRERREDVIDLTAHFFRRRGMPEPELTDESRRILLGHSWPGNVRELENELERLIALHNEPARITPAMFSDRVAMGSGEVGLDLRTLYEAPLARAVSYLEENRLKKALIQADWNKSQTARKLGLSRQGLINKIKKYGIRRESLANSES